MSAIAVTDEPGRRGSAITGRTSVKCAHLDQLTPADQGGYAKPIVLTVVTRVTHRDHGETMRAGTAYKKALLPVADGRASCRSAFITLESIAARRRPPRC
jgi:hypothetical protein